MPAWAVSTVDATDLHTASGQFAAVKERSSLADLRSTERSRYSSCREQRAVQGLHQYQSCTSGALQSCEVVLRAGGSSAAVPSDRSAGRGSNTGITALHMCMSL